MIKIWLPIILGVLIFPIISTKMKDLEDKLMSLSQDTKSLEYINIKKDIKRYKILILILFVMIFIFTALFLRTTFTD
ncbi:hypothetical protein A2V49_03345 [candidate division WWE3 bacterium RBG_19FT_COMBO_34_6]|uniref:Uncharacterized protein n=1 Tax=candidate division WWE3 bacterium RBG_19FT_COMBO_34_6 TaxID=1802612 RepID=A0A1F4UKF1_UNCKA|nr:MAG: hypothetical protein A2V49_03345 [candidate division WWE3 bacterium RBG_19FT_COMBO_34_6]